MGLPGGEVFPIRGWRGRFYLGEVAGNLCLKCVCATKLLQLKSCSYFPRGRTFLQTKWASYEEYFQLKTSSSPLGTRLTPRTSRQR